MTPTAPSSRQRVDWVDYAKGFCICFVVMMHSTLGVEQALGQQGWMHALVAFAKPFRMPDFFMISGLFLAQVIARDWRTYFDRKVAHFAYFYVLWTAIQFAVKAPAFVHDSGLAGMLWAYIESFWEPFGTLWFIYLLPIFFVVTKLAYQWRIPPLAVWIAAAGLQIAAIDTGHMVIDEFAARFVYFYTGYLLAPRIFALASYIQALPESAFAGLAAWALLDGLLVFYGLSELPLVGLTLGLIGATAVVAISALMAKRSLFRPLRYLGQNSIVIYLAFFLFMAASRTLLIRGGWIGDVGTISVLVTLAGVIGPVLLFWAVRHTPLRFLFARPTRFWLTTKPRLILQPAE